MGIKVFPIAYLTKMSQISRITLRGTWKSHMRALEALTPPIPSGRRNVKGRLEILDFDENSFHNDVVERFSNTLTHPQALLGISHLRVLKLNGSSPELIHEARKIIELAVKAFEYFIWDLLSCQWGRRYYHHGLYFLFPRSSFLSEI